MPARTRLDAAFFDHSALVVARALLGQRLVRLLEGKRIAGIITETEAYDGEEDLASHARAGRTARTQIMYGPAGHAYVYFTYGVHWMLNIVTGPGDFPSAVLLRSIIAVEGLDAIAVRRKNQPPSAWTNGPAKICQALEIDGRLNGRSLISPSSEVWVEAETQLPDAGVVTGARVGIPNVPEPWRSMPWRFMAEVSHDAGGTY